MHYMSYEMLRFIRTATSQIVWSTKLTPQEQSEALYELEDMKGRIR